MTAKRHAGLAVLALVMLASGLWAAQKQALIFDGRNNHAWKLTTPSLRRALEEMGMFRVDVATAPERNEDMVKYRPNFAKYDVVISNYTDLGNGGVWPEETKAAFVQYVSSGGGFVAVHAASSAFPEWKEFNEIVGLGGWGGRNEKSGPYVRYRDGAIVREEKPGGGGHHGKQHAFQVVVRDAGHPITAGLPAVWMHAQDELFDSLRGPARGLTVLATAYSDPATGGSGEHEPALFIVRYGKGRVFNTVLGHSPEAMRCVGFITTLQRAAEWAATGRVTQDVPEDFPKPEEARIRP